MLMDVKEDNRKDDLIAVICSPENHQKKCSNCDRANYTHVFKPQA